MDWPCSDGAEPWPTGQRLPLTTPSLEPLTDALVSCLTPISTREHPTTVGEAVSQGHGRGIGQTRVV